MLAPTLKPLTQTRSHRWHLAKVLLGRDPAVAVTVGSLVLLVHRVVAGHVLLVGGVHVLLAGHRGADF